MSAHGPSPGFCGAWQRDSAGQWPAEPGPDTLVRAVIHGHRRELAAPTVGTHLAVQAAIAIDDHHINHSVLGANQAIPQHEQTRRLRRDPPTEDDVRNAIERATVSAKRIEIVLSESIVAEGQDRVLTLPWTRTSSRRRREIIQRVGEAQQPLRAMRTKARDGFEIRDKVAASKRKGIWMGGAVPLGYRVEDRALHVVEQEAEFVRSLFRRYLEVGSVVRLKTALDAENIRSPVRMRGLAKGPAASRSREATYTGCCRTRSTSDGCATKGKSRSSARCLRTRRRSFRPISGRRGGRDAPCRLAFTLAPPNHPYAVTGVGRP